ncbi:efflux RND transporter permease subunit [Kordiimonas gwangyangensis]|uniref:efflux RND transporter permease subunit n=1 Tax=Kordiimonas gwangyangensis TaxID=288022 RepID=UPI000379D1ED|nr:efflux RND transporter permease subunit [Kordiimonas gwangyangensis]
MDFLTRLGLNRSRFTLLLMIALVLSGLLLYKDFPKREAPEITIRTAIVSALYPGMPPERIENLVAERVERKIREIAEVKEIRTILTTGRMRTYVELKDSVNDLEPIWQSLRDKMSDISRELPEGAYGPFVNTDFGEVTVASIAMTAEGFTYREMEESAKDMQRRLYTVDGIAKVELFGVQEERIWLELDARRFKAVGGQLNTLINDLQNQNVVLPAGEINAEGASILLEATGDFKSVRDIENMLTRAVGGDELIRLKDLVKVRRGYVSPPENRVYYNGRPALVLAVQMQPGYDIEDVGERLTEAMHTFEHTLPIGYELNFATYQPTEVSKTVAGALSNVGQTFIVVLLVVLAFLGVRSGLVISSIVPFAVMFALLGMNALGIALEQVSIAAVIISLGLLVDNGVVIVEDILTRVDRGSKRRTAALAAGSQYAVPLAVSSLTTIFAFTPFFLLEGSEGEYAFSLGAVLALTLIGSWITALYFLPLICARVLRKRTEGEEGIEHKAEAEDLPAFARMYENMLRPSLRAAAFVVIGTYGVVIVTGQLFTGLPKEMFPVSDRNEVLIYLDMPKSAHFEATERVALDVSNWISDGEVNPEVEDHIIYVGEGGPRFYLSLNPVDPSPSKAFILVNTKSPEQAAEFGARAKRYFYEQVPDARFTIKRLAMGASESGQVKIEISGPEHEPLLVAGREVERIFAGVPGIVQNESDWGEKLVKMVIEVDQDKARRLNMSSQTLAQNLNAYFDGFEVSNFRDDDSTIPIMLRALERDRDSLEDLLNIILPGEDSIVPLEQLAVLKPALEYSQTWRKNQQPTITVTAKSSQLPAAELYAQVKDQIDAIPLGEGYQVVVGGELKDSAEIYGKLGAGLPFALLLMILVVMYQFNSFRRIAIIFMSVPLVLVGVPFGLMITGQPMSFFAILGLISLSGIIINNAIVLVDQIDIEREEMRLMDAIVSAAGQRLRPIMLTSITTVIGLLPLYLFGGPLWEPLAVVMMFGLAMASVLTLFFVPATYMLFFRTQS